MKLQDDGKVDFMFEKTQDVLQSLKQKIKDGSATNRGVKSENFGHFLLMLYTQCGIILLLFIISNK